MFIPHIADSRTATMNIIDVDVILACFGGTLVIDHKFTLLCL